MTNGLMTSDLLKHYIVDTHTVDYLLAIVTGNSPANVEFPINAIAVE